MGERAAETAGSTAAGRSPSTSWALAALSLPMLLSSLGTSIANVGLPALAEAFGASFQAVQWIVLAYLLAVTTLIVAAGSLGDIAGRRQVLLGGIFVFSAGSFVCAVAPNLGVLLVARAVQGAGAAAMMAMSVALVRQTASKSRTGRAMGILGTMSAVGTALGPALGGALIAGFGWWAIFAVSVPAGALAFRLARRHLPLDDLAPAAGRPGFDLPGTVLLALTLTAFTLALTIGGGGFGAVNVALALVGFAGLSLFVLVEGRVENPLISMTLLRDPILVAGLATSMLVATVLMATLVVGPFYLADGLGLGPASVGLILALGPVGAALTGVPAGRIVDRFGAEPTAIAGAIGIAAGCLTLSGAPASLGIAGYVVPITLVTTSYALFQTANNTAVMGNVRNGPPGILSGLLNLSRNLGLITGASLMGTVFSVAAGAGDVATATPEAVAAGMRVTFGVAAGLMVAAGAIAVTARRHRGPALTEG